MSTVTQNSKYGMCEWTYGVLFGIKFHLDWRILSRLQGQNPRMWMILDYTGDPIPLPFPFPFPFSFPTGWNLAHKWTCGMLLDAKCHTVIVEGLGVYCLGSITMLADPTNIWTACTSR